MNVFGTEHLNKHFRNEFFLHNNREAKYFRTLCFVQCSQQHSQQFQS